MSAATRTALVAAAAAAIALAGTAPAVAASLRGPSRARIGHHVTLRATGLISGNYRAYIEQIASRPKGGHAVACAAGFTFKVHVAGGSARFAGLIPRRMTCYQGFTQVGKVGVTRGHFNFVVASPVRAGSFNGRLSYVQRPVTITG